MYHLLSAAACLVVICGLKASRNYSQFFVINAQPSSKAFDMVALDAAHD